MQRGEGRNAAPARGQRTEDAGRFELGMQHIDVPAMHIAKKSGGAADIQQAPQWDEIDWNAPLLQVLGRRISLPDLQRAHAHIEAGRAKRWRRQAEELFRAAHSEPIDYEKDA